MVANKILLYRTIHGIFFNLLGTIHLVVKTSMMEKVTSFKNVPIVFTEAQRRDVFHTNPLFVTYPFMNDTISFRERNREGIVFPLFWCDLTQPLSFIAANSLFMRSLQGQLWYAIHTSASYIIPSFVA